MDSKKHGRRLGAAGAVLILAMAAMGSSAAAKPKTITYQAVITSSLNPADVGNPVTVDFNYLTGGATGRHTVTADSERVFTLPSDPPALLAGPVVSGLVEFAGGGFLSFAFDRDENAFTQAPSSPGGRGQISDAGTLDHGQFFSLNAFANPVDAPRRLGNHFSSSDLGATGGEFIWDAFGGSGDIHFAPTSLAISVPEPMTWALMLSGLAAVGAAARSARARALGGTV
jgi:hypothetical protein